MIPEPGLIHPSIPLLPAEGQYAPRSVWTLDLGTTLREWQVELKLEEMALGGDYKLQNISSTLWRNSNSPLFLTLFNKLPLSKTGYPGNFYLFKVEFLLLVLVHLLTRDSGRRYEMHEPQPLPPPLANVNNQTCSLSQSHTIHCQWAEPCNQTTWVSFLPSSLFDLEWGFWSLYNSSFSSYNMGMTRGIFSWAFC